ncbi:MAG: DNA helicase RecQ [Cyanobacteria bacterium DS2.3.42]|nr:DNA helicase RecQ [Cyanobacteria bacterium DS2.3.42]
MIKPSPMIQCHAESYMQTLPSQISQLNDIVAKHWGIHELRPLQQPAMCSVLEGRDSLVVMPTGGGKSLCFQAPAVLRGDTTVVISPLISLMKDQVDGLIASGIAAIALNSSQTPEERFRHEKDILNGKIRLLFVSPERLVQTDMQDLLRKIDVRTFAIDEAHCISHWGHDFRPEYRQMRMLKTMFPKASVHAYTATATEQVRTDIIQQLGLKDPEILVGNFDRANLSYRIISRRGGVLKQVQSVIDRHKKEGGIIYCIRRAEVDELTKDLKAAGIKAMAYHAGLTAQERSKTQEAFSEEHCDVVVATVAFGMGIDRSNVRYVLHTAMPKSLEAYQQETGRAGRDGLEAECVLLHSGADVFTWKAIMQKAAADQNQGQYQDNDMSYLETAYEHLHLMDRYCRGAACRHSLLVQHFGQTYDKDNCGACDICLGETVEVEGALVIAQKILSCVARLKEKYGIGYVAAVLRGENSQEIRDRGGHSLSTYGLLKEYHVNDLRDWMYQLISQEVLVQENVEYGYGRTVPILKLNGGSWNVMRGERTNIRLLKPAERKKGERAKLSKAETGSWDGVDRDLFESMRELRRQLADERRVPPYIIFPDSTLRELARIRPSSLERMRMVSGIGDSKLRDLGQTFLDIVLSHCKETGLSLDA